MNDDARKAAVGQPPAGEADQVRALTRTFLARFFENEITEGTNDLKQSFFFLISFLAVPGFFMPIIMDPGWDVTAGSVMYRCLRGVPRLSREVCLAQGLEAVRVMSRVDKTLYLGAGMIATACICAVVWSTLLVDRRDALVLGALPVRPATVVRAKLASLGAYVALIAAGMHALASVSFGLSLASGYTLARFARGTGAHFLASFLASAFVMLTVAGVQGSVLATCGPRAFSRLSSALQAGMVALTLLALFWLPTLSHSVNNTLAGAGPNARPWILLTPPLWFLGVYEWGLGTRDPLLIHLAGRAAIGLIGAATLTMVSYPIAYRRLSMSAIESAGGIGGFRGTARMTDLLARVLAWSSPGKAVTSFFLATITRVERHRFIIAIALGGVAACSAPTALKWLSFGADAPRAPQLDLFALPLTTIAFLLLGMRAAAALPSDLGAAWVFRLTPPTVRQSRTSLGRVMFALGVLPIVTVMTVCYWRLWGATVAVTHASVCLLLGACLIEFLLRSAPVTLSADPWRPETEHLRKWWPLYIAAFVTYTHAIPALELSLFAVPYANLWLIASLAICALLFRITSFWSNPLPADDIDSLAAVNVLHLN